MRRSIRRGTRDSLGVGAAPLATLLAVVAVACGGSGAPASADLATPTPPASPAAPGPVAIDPTLLAALPPSVDGLAVTELPDAESAARADTSVAPLAERLAVGYVGSTDRTDWAIAWVVALRPGVFSDGMFRSWRDTFDAEACATQGGVGGHAEATLGGRTTSIATCGPLVLHHVRLESPDRLVAITSTGPARLGERIVAGLVP